MVAGLRDLVDVSRNCAATIVRNELGNASVYAQRKGQRQAGVTHYIWLTAQDFRVRDARRARHGKTFACNDPPQMGTLASPFSAGVMR
ncbi:minor capsid protein [Deinococcus taeanensis]|nr:minor capsid protein [Deinococcus taeanensis]